MQIRTFYGSESLGVFLLYDLRDENAPVCEIWCFYHNPNTLVDFWILAPLGPTKNNIRGLFAVRIRVRICSFLADHGLNAILDCLIIIKN